VLVKNRQIAETLEKIADILEFKEDNIFRINSYRKAARVINELTEDIEILSAEGMLQKIPGIGSAMAENIKQYLTEGRIDKYEELKKGIPDGIVDMLNIPGLGPKTLALIYNKLGISKMSALEKAIEKKKLQILPGMGEKKEANILRGIKLFKKYRNRSLLGLAFPIVDELIQALKGKGVTMLSPAGSFRRRKEDIGDIDILAGAKDGKGIIRDFVKQPIVREILAEGNTKGSVIIENGLQVDLRVVNPSSFGAALQYFTGSKAHNIHLREIAKGRGLKINEYGVFKGAKRIAGRKEEDIYNALNLEWIPPTLREDRGEIEASANGTLPHLITRNDIQGDLHVHSEWSDGAESIEEIARAAKRMGYKYIVISDHSQSTKIAGGLSTVDIEKEIAQIKQVNKKINGITILCGTECDIKNDGSMDFPDSLLGKLDIVIGAIHSGFKQDEAKLTKRIITAMKNPNVDIIAHPTGRLINSRKPYPLDLGLVFKAAADTGTVLEINAHYNRLDLNDILARKAKDMGIMLSIDTDAHHISQLEMMDLGIAVAQRAWLEKKNILNTMCLNELRQWLGRKK